MRSAFAISAIVLTRSFIAQQQQILLPDAAGSVAHKLDIEIAEEGTLARAARALLVEERYEGMRIDIFDSNGQPLAVKLNGTTRSTFTYSIPAGGTFVLAPRDQNGQTPM